MKRILLFVLVAFTAATFALAQEEAITASGKKVMLHKDGTWTFVKDAPDSTPKPNNVLPGPQTPSPSSGAARTSGSTTPQSVVPASSTATKRTTSVQCSGTTQKGARCRRMTLAANGRCYQH